MEEIMDKKRLTAVVFGATGAVGEALVQQLVVSPSVKKVVTVGRRILENVPPEKERTADLLQYTVNMDALEKEATDACAGADVVFCALGTTRKVAGSADAFRKVDLEYVDAAARLARAATVPHFSLVSATGANARCPANDLAIFHPLLYTKVKGMAEQTVIDKGFPRVSIFRPGLLERGSKSRMGEKLFTGLVPSIDVKDVAKLMLLDALRESNTTRPVMRFEMPDLLKAAKAGGQPPANSS